MEIRYKKQFLKDLVKLPLSFRKKVEKFAFEIIPNENTFEIKQKVSKLKSKNNENYYKIRIGDYRIGLYIGKNFLEFKRVLHRKDIYRYFP